MTSAQKTAKEKFKKAIEYRKKTGVSLKEAFAHIYGKKISNTRKLVFDYLEVPKGKKVSGTGNKYTYKVYDRNDFGEPINNSFKNVNINASSLNDALNKIYKKFPSKDYFIELMNSKSTQIKRRKKQPVIKNKRNIDFFNIVSGVGNIESSVSNILGVKVGIKKINNIDAVSLKLYDISNKKTIVVISIYNTQKDIKNEIAPDFSAYIFKNTRESGFTNKETETINKKILNYCNGILQEVKNLNKNVVKAVTKKVAVKKPVAKKVARQTRSPRKVKATYKVDYQTGTSNRTDRGKNQDAKRKALPPGKRLSNSGKTYYETRANRTDFSRKAMTGIGIRIGNMPTYNDKDAARDLQIFADNDFMLYQQRKKPILLNLEKKYKKGTYDINKATKLWRNYIDSALQKYHIQYGSKRDKWYEMLSVPDRNLLSLEYAIETKKIFDNGEFLN